MNFFVDLIVFRMCICAIPVFFKVPGAGVLDLGGRTEGTILNYP